MGASVKLTCDMCKQTIMVDAVPCIGIAGPDRLGYIDPRGVPRNWRYTLVDQVHRLVCSTSREIAAEKVVAL